MDIEQAVLEKLRSLPPHKQREVLDFVDFLRAGRLKGPRKSLKGLWLGLAGDISEEDIAEMRRELWEGFSGRDV
jgi:hypothetical protein